MNAARQITCTLGVLLAFTAKSLAGTAQADIEEKYNFATGGGASSKFVAYSNSTVPLVRGPNDFTFYKIQYSGQTPPFGNPTTVTPVPVDNGATIKIPTGLFGWGAGKKYSPVVSQADQPKPNNQNNIYDMSLSSTSIDFMGSTYCYSKKGVINISAKASILAPKGTPVAGQAAGEAIDPIPVYNSTPVQYAPIFGAEVQLDDMNQSGGAAIFATDTYIDPNADNWDYESDPTSMWRLTMNADGPVSSVSDLNVTFDFNPAALNEITFNSYLASLPGYYPGISNANLALLIDSQVESMAESNITITSGDAVLNDIQLFPDDTIYTPFNATQDYSEGAVGNIEAVPEPASAALLAMGFVACGLRRRKA